MNGTIKVIVNSMQPALNVSHLLGFRKKMKSDNKVDLFYGFWKYLGVIGSISFGLSFVWWGALVIINDWAQVKEVFGPMGSIVLMPLIIGLALFWFGVAEFLRTIRE